MELNRNLTNDQILANANIKEAIDKGELVIIDMVPTSNPEYTNLYFIGKVTGLAESNTNVSVLSAQLLGWKDGIYMRSIQNASTAIAEKLQIGESIMGTMRVVDSIEPEFDGQNPRIDREGNQLLHNNNPIYRNTFICTHEELEEQGHSTLEVTEKVGQQPLQPNKQFNQQAGSQGNVGGSKKSSVKTLIGNNA